MDCATDFAEVVLELLRRPSPSIDHKPIHDAQGTFEVFGCLRDLGGNRQVGLGFLSRIRRGNRDRHRSSIVGTGRQYQGRMSLNARAKRLARVAT